MQYCDIAVRGTLSHLIRQRPVLRYYTIRTQAFFCLLIVSYLYSLLSCCCHPSNKCLKNIHLFTFKTQRYVCLKYVSCVSLEHTTHVKNIIHWISDFITKIRKYLIHKQNHIPHKNIFCMEEFMLLIGYEIFARLNSECMLPVFPTPVLQCQCKILQEILIRSIKNLIQLFCFSSNFM